MIARRNLDVEFTAARRRPISFTDEFSSFLEVLAAALCQGSAVHNVLINGGEHDGTVIPVEARR